LPSTILGKQARGARASALAKHYLGKRRMYSTELLILLFFCLYEMNDKILITSSILLFMNFFSTNAFWYCDRSQFFFLFFFVQSAGYFESLSGIM